MVASRQQRAETFRRHQRRGIVVAGFWRQVAANTAPEPRKYALLEANYLQEQLRLYLQVGSSDGTHVYKVAPLGPLVSFSSPEEQVDRTSQLHVLWQTGAQSFAT